MGKQMATPQFQPKYHWKRRRTQFGMLLLIILIPIFGLFRIDLATASFLHPRSPGGVDELSLSDWTGHRGWYRPILTYMTIGSVFCGWACPQNLFSEMADGLTHKLLGKRADVRIDGPGMIVAASKNKVINWLILGSSFLAASAVLAFFFLMFFYTRSDMWAFVTGESRPAAEHDRHVLDDDLFHLHRYRYRTLSVLRLSLPVSCLAQVLQEPGCTPCIL